MRAALLLLVVGCGGGHGTGGAGGGGGSGGAGGGHVAMPGDLCTGMFLCSSATAVLACESLDGGPLQRRFAEYPCRGPNGCTANMQRVVCDQRGALLADKCPEISWGTGFCADAGELMRCEAADQHWHDVACPNCREQNGSILCN